MRVADTRSASVVMPEPRAGWRDRLRSARDGLLASAKFREWAAAFPLTRPLARRRAQALFDLCGGFVYSQVLFACVQLRLFDTLALRPQSVGALAQRCQLSTDAMLRLLSAAVALRLVARVDAEHYGLGPLGAPLAGNAGLTAMIEHHALLYADLADPLALLREARPETALSRYWAYPRASEPAGVDAAQVVDYTHLMAASQALVAAEILAAYPLDRHRCLMDVGGGDGSFLVAAALRAPALDFILFDLPAVAARGATRLAAAGLAGRARVIGGSFRSDPLPAGADLVTLVRVLHDHDDAVVRLLLRAVHAALPAGGTLLIAEPLAGTPGAQRMGDAYFGFYLLAMGSGRPRSEAELTTLLRDAGFATIERRPTHLPLQTSVIVARR